MFTNYALGPYHVTNWDDLMDLPTDLHDEVGRVAAKRNGVQTNPLLFMMVGNEPSLASGKDLRNAMQCSGEATPNTPRCQCEPVIRLLSGRGNRRLFPRILDSAAHHVICRRHRSATVSCGVDARQEICN